MKPKLPRGTPWSPEELHILRAEWHVVAARTLSEKLSNRTWAAITACAVKIGLPRGIPRGYVSIREAAKKCGFMAPKLREILAQAGVEVHIQYPGAESKVNRRRKRTVRYVEIDDCEEAVQNYLETETIADAARRIGMSRALLYRWMRKDGIVKQEDTDRSHKRMHPSVADEVVKRHKAVPHTPRVSWTNEEKETLKLAWQILPADELMKRLPGRTWRAISVYAKLQLKLPFGTPKGCMTIRQAEAWSGLNRETIERLLKEHKIPLLYQYPRRDVTPKLVQRRYFDRLRFEAVLETFLSLETTGSVARRHNVSTGQAYRWLLDAGLLEKGNPRNRVDSAKADAVLRERCAARSGRTRKSSRSVASGTSSAHAV